MLDVAETVKKIRDQRMHSVQNEQQYVFIYRVIIDYIRCAHTVCLCLSSYLPI